MGIDGRLLRFCVVGHDRRGHKAIAGCPACLAQFYDTRKRRPHEADSSRWFFGRALLVPVFRYIVYNWIQQGLICMRSFPGFLAKLKSVRTR